MEISSCFRIGCVLSSVHFTASFISEENAGIQDVQEAFEDIKSRLFSVTILAYSDVNKGTSAFIVNTNAINEGIGGARSQI